MVASAFSLIKTEMPLPNLAPDMAYGNWPVTIGIWLP
jgi:hypothetical protein